MGGIERMRYNEPEEQRSVAVEREPAMDLRRLTEQVRKLHALLGVQSERITSLESILASHEKVLGEIGAYEVERVRDVLDIRALDGDSDE